MSEIKPKKERKFLKALGKIGEVLIQELFFRVGSNLIRKIGGKKTLPSILFLLASLSLFAQFPNTGNKQRLGFQTTGDGLVWRGSLSDTASIQPINNQNAWVILDTINLKFYTFDFTSNIWNLVGGALTMPFDSITFNTAKNGTVGVGEVEYNDTQGSLIQGLKGGNVTNVIGQQLHQRVNNRTGAPLAKGDVVYLAGSQGNRITVAKGLAVSDAFSANTFGVVAESIADNQSGFIITEGLITGLNTSALTEDSAVYLSPTVAGALTSTKPQAPQHSVYIGVCVKSNNGSGELFVKIRNGQELDELHDVRITSPVDRASLYYRSSEKLWRDTTAALLVSDTASMLTPYLRKADTTNMLLPYFRDADTTQLNLTSRFAAKLNLSDTSNMLVPYLRKADTTNMLSPYFRDSDTSLLNLTSRFEAKQNTLTNPVTGTGTNNFVPKFTSTGSIIGDANLFTNGNRFVQNEGIDQSFGWDKMGNTSSPFFGNNVKAGSGVERIQRTASTTFFNPSAIIFGFQRVNNFSGATSYGGINFMTTSGNPSGDINPIDYSRMFIQPNGNIGIGTMEPGYKFDIRGTLGVTGATTLGSTLAVTGNITEAGNNVLTSADTTSMLLPYWRSGNFSGVLPVVNGGTNTSTLTANKIMVGNGTSGVLTPTNLHWDNTNSRLGINRIPGGYALDITGDLRITGELITTENITLGNGASQTGFIINSSGATNQGPVIRLIKAGVTKGYIGVSSGIIGGTSDDLSSYSVNSITFHTKNQSTTKMILDTIGRLGIGQTTPTAVLHLKQGTSTASTAPLKFTSGTNLTTAEAGAMEFNGTNLFFSPSTTRHTVNHGLTGSATLNFPSTTTLLSADLTITVTGAADGDVVSLGVPNAAVNANTCYTAWVSAANTVTVRFNNYSSGTVDPASGLFKVFVTK